MTGESIGEIRKLVKKIEMGAARNGKLLLKKSEVGVPKVEKGV